MANPATIAVVGSGPAGLMAATVVARAGHRVRLFEKRPAAGRKLLIAGRSGLNVSADLGLAEMIAHYTPADRMRPWLQGFPPEAWLRFLGDLGVRTFRGTSRRWFVEGMKAPPLLTAWLEELRRLGVERAHGQEWIGFAADPAAAVGGVDLRFADAPSFRCDACVLCLGGGSWESEGVRWPDNLQAHGLEVTPLRPSNVGFAVDWPAPLLAEAEGQPVKNVTLRSARGERTGDLVITAYGLEGTPLYFVGHVGPVHLDLKPDLDMEGVRRRLLSCRENLSPMRRIQRTMKLGRGALALLYHASPRDAMSDVDAVAALIKAFPLHLLRTQPLAEAISSAGGLAWSELDDALMLRRFPGLFAAGEMIDWDAPTGGFLIQGCVSQGHAAGMGVARYVEALTPPARSAPGPSPRRRHRPPERPADRVPSTGKCCR